MKDCFAVPVIQRGLAAWSDTAIQGCQHHILATGQSLVTLGGITIDGFNDAEFFGEIPQSGQGTELVHYGL